MKKHDDDDEPELPYGGEPPSQKHSQTSKEAAARIKYRVGPMHRTIMRWMAEHPEGACDERMAQHLGFGLNTFRPRRRELQLMGYVMDSGRTELTEAICKAVIWVRVPGDGD